MTKRIAKKTRDMLIEAASLISTCIATGIVTGVLISCMNTGDIAHYCPEGAIVSLEGNFQQHHIVETICYYIDGCTDGEVGDVAENAFRDALSSNAELESHFYKDMKYEIYLLPAFHCGENWVCHAEQYYCDQYTLIKTEYQ